MKKGIIIGISISLGIAAIAAIVTLCIVLNSGFKVRDDGFVIPENDYSKFVSSCEIDYMMALDTTTNNIQKWSEIKPFKTGRYTKDGYPIWAVGMTYKGIGSNPDITFMCRLATDSESAYLIDLTANGLVIKTYSNYGFYNEKGNLTTAF